MHDHNQAPPAPDRSKITPERAPLKDAGRGLGASVAPHRNVLNARTLLALNRKAGNAAVSRLIKGENTPKIKELTETGPPGAEARDDVHSDNGDSEVAHSLRAQTRTIGHDVVLENDQYRPEMPTGQRLLAHDRTHMIHQTGGSSTRDGASSAIPEDPKTRPQLQRQPADDKSRIADIKAAIISDLGKAAPIYAQASARFSQLSGGALDPAIVEIVREQGRSVKENLDLLSAFVLMLAAMPEEGRRTILGASAIELQQFVTNTDHLLVLHRVANMSVPDVFRNKEEAQDRLDDIAEWHESWIDANIDVGGLAGDLVAVGLNLQKQAEVSQPVAEHFADYQSRLQQQAAALSDISSWLSGLDAEIQQKKSGARILSLLEKVQEILSYVPGRRGRRPKKSRTKAGRAKGAKERQQKREKKKRKKKKTKELRWNLRQMSSIARESGGVPGTLDPNGPLPRSAPIHAHHVWPKYVGGPEIQPLMSVRESVHQGVIHTTIHAPLILTATAMGFSITPNGKNLTFKAYLKVNPSARAQIAAVLTSYYASLSTRTDPGIPPPAYLQGIGVSQTTM